METLKKRSDFVYLQHHCDKKLFNKAFMLLVRRTDKGVVRCGYLVTKKIDKRAVVRNKIKRQMREMMRAAFKDGILSHSCDYELIAHKDFLKKSFKATKEEIYNLLRS